MSLKFQKPSAIRWPVKNFSLSLTISCFLPLYALASEPVYLDEQEVRADQNAAIEATGNADYINFIVEQVQPLSAAQINEIFPGNPENPHNVKRIEVIFDEIKTKIIEGDLEYTDGIDDEEHLAWDYLVRERAEEYTYENFLKGMGAFPAICAEYSSDSPVDTDTVCRKTLATMFAHFARETGGNTDQSEIPAYLQGLHHVREMTYTEDSRNAYAGECNPATWQGEFFPCGTDDDGNFYSYFGRGAKQLSYNYNYGKFSALMNNGDPTVYLDDPSVIADTYLNFASATFFFIFPQPPKPSMLHVIDGTWQPSEADLAAGRKPGFGLTTMIINGGVECGGQTEHIFAQQRFDYYKGLASLFGVEVDPNEVGGCAGMQQFDEQGSTALNSPLYWENNWATEWTGAMKCQLVSYETPHAIYSDLGYDDCLFRYYNAKVIPADGPPIADAGDNQSVSTLGNEITFTLDGSRSEVQGSDKDIIKYEWTNLGTGTSYESGDPIYPKTLNEYTLGEIEYSLVVTDSENVTSENEAIVSINIIDPAPVVTLNTLETVYVNDEFTIEVIVNNLSNFNSVESCYYIESSHDCLEQDVDNYNSYIFKHEFDAGQTPGQYTFDFEVTATTEQGDEYKGTLPDGSEPTVIVEIKEKPAEPEFPLYLDAIGSISDGDIIDHGENGLWQCYGPWASNCNVTTFAPGFTDNMDWIEQQWRRFETDTQ